MKVLCRCDLYFVKQTSANLKICRFRENLTFDPPKLGQISRIKNHATNREYSSRAIRWFFLLSSTTLSFEMRGGRINPPPLPPACPRYEIGRAWARVKGS